VADPISFATIMLYLTGLTMHVLMIVVAVAVKLFQRKQKRTSE